VAQLEQVLQRSRLQTQQLWAMGSVFLEAVAPVQALVLQVAAGSVLVTSVVPPMQVLVLQVVAGSVLLLSVVPPMQVLVLQVVAGSALVVLGGHETVSKSSPTVVALPPQ